LYMGKTWLGKDFKKMGLEKETRTISKGFII
jgi:hypothetical protein